MINDSPTGFHTGNGSCSELFPSSGYSHAAIHRRLVDSSFVSGRMPLGEGHGVGFMPRVRHMDKFNEIPVNSSPVCDLFGNGPMLSEFEGFSNPQTEEYSMLNNRRISVLKECARLFWVISPP